MSRPIRIVVMGVSGSGKSTVGMALAERLGLAFIEGDLLHPAENVAKMSGGTPLTDEDRWPWLDRITAKLLEAENGAVASCSALKKVYRDRLRAGVGSSLRFLYLEGNDNLLALRMTSRKGHFMKAGMLASQLATLEPPVGEDDASVQDANLPVGEIVETTIEWIRTGESSS